MAKVLVLYNSMYSHIETMAKAIPEGAGVTIRQVPDPVPEDVVKKQLS